MMRSISTMAIALAFALPALAQQPTRPREGDDIARLREQIRDLETKLNESGKKDEKKKDEKKDEPKRPMGGGFTGGGFGGPGASGPMGGYGGAGGFPMGRGGAGDRPAQSGMNGPDLARMPGFDNLSKDEQKMLMALVAKMRTPTPESSSTGAGRADVDARLDRLEKAIEEIKGLLRGQGGPGAGGRPGPSGPAPGAPGGR